MSYRDPYAGHRYNASEDYNPYSGTAQPHPTYEQGGYETYGNYGAEGYRDEPFDPNAQATHQHTYSGAPVPPPKDEDQRSGFDRDEFTNEKCVNMARNWIEADRLAGQGSGTGMPMAVCGRRSVLLDRFALVRWLT